MTMTNSPALKPELVSTLKDFCSYVENLAKESRQSDRSLEEFLRALWLLVQENQKAKASYTLFAQMLSQSLTSKIAPFDSGWLEYTSPPPEIGTRQPVEDGIGFVKKMLLYQIADLHRMKEQGVLDQPPHILWLGASRKGGRTWYNFLPSTFLSCALGGLNANSETMDCDWSILAVFLWLGQIYE